MMSTQSSNSFDFLRSRSNPEPQVKWTETRPLISGLTFGPDIPARRDGKDEKESDEQE
jgi:hypothetical protein